MAKHRHHFLFATLFALYVCLLGSCTKETIDASTPTKAVFWTASDLGCGAINVSINGETRQITGYNSSEPTCGSNFAATFELPAGNYSFTASCGSISWQGNIEVLGSRCNAYRLNGSGTVTLPGGGTSGNTAPTVTTPSTIFLSSADYSVSQRLAYTTESFTVNTTTTFVFRFASQFQAQAAIITPDQLANFKNGSAFTGYGLFNNQFGTNSVTLSAGTYYLAVRNTVNGANKWSYELDKTIGLPTSDRATFADVYVRGAQSVGNGGRLWQPFTIQSGFRYFIDGCNVNCQTWFIPADQLEQFKNGQTFKHFSDYVGKTGGGEPGLFELKLPAGDYYLVALGNGSGTISYSMERWRIN